MFLIVFSFFGCEAETDRQEIVLEEVATDQELQQIHESKEADLLYFGADIEYLKQATPLQVRELANLAISVNQLIENLNKISIALINGFALGGGLELAESCMLRVAVSSSKFGHPEV